MAEDRLRTSVTLRDIRRGDVLKVTDARFGLTPDRLSFMRWLYTSCSSFARDSLQDDFLSVTSDWKVL